VIGLGQRGGAYARELARGAVPRATLAAVCDVVPETLRAFRGVAGYASAAELVDAGGVDALVVATPPTEHASLALRALEAGLHVLVEKPLSPRKLDCEAILRCRARLGPGAPLLATALPLRADPRYRRIHALVTEGTLGRLSRIAWTVTDCFRSSAYYAEQAWRGTLGGEGGGLLLNQCLHQLDLWGWLFGMPCAVQAFCEFGRDHEIEVEDRVTAYLEHRAGPSGVFIASSGEAAGTNRLEIVGESARIVLEGEELELTRYALSVTEGIRTGGVRARGPLFTRERERIEPARVGPAELLQNFTAAISGEASLIAPGSEAVLAVELANALWVSGVEERRVELPLDGQAFSDALKQRQIDTAEALYAERGR
jgi:predicted dehydrogenase